MKLFICFNLIFWIQQSFAQNILGIDVSHHQGNINWQLVANDGKVFAYCKATEGMTYQDPRFVTNMQNGNNAGVVMGAYHFARPDNNTAIQDADNFINTAGAYIGNGYLPPALDLENPNSTTHLDLMFTSTELTAWVQAWFDRVESQTGVRPVIYLNSNFANYLDASLNSYGLWIAKPGTSPTTPPNDIGNWNDWLFKQYSWYGSVNGISGNVDLNVFHGSTTDFNNLISTNDVVEIQQTNIKIFPNPVKGFLYIKSLNNTSIDNVKIFDLYGRFLKEINKPDEKIDVRFLNPDIYFLQINNKSQERISVKIIKQ